MISVFNPPTIEELWASVPDRRPMPPVKMGGRWFPVAQVKGSEIGDVKLVIEIE